MAARSTRTRTCSSQPLWTPRSRWLAVRAGFVVGIALSGVFGCGRVGYDANDAAAIVDWLEVQDGSAPDAAVVVDLAADWLTPVDARSPDMAVAVRDLAVMDASRPRPDLTADFAMPPPPDATTVFPDSSVIVDAASDFAVAPPDASTPPPDQTADQTVIVQPDLVLDCPAVLLDPASASDDDVTTCGIAGLLGQCHLSDASGCGSCSCRYYVTQTTICPSGVCGPPLDGTGCAKSTYYGGTTPEGFVWNCTQSSDLAVGACMLRRLMAVGLCPP